MIVDVPAAPARSTRVRRRRWISAASRPGLFISATSALFRLTGQAAGEDLVREHVNEFGGQRGRDVTNSRQGAKVDLVEALPLISANAPGKVHARNEMVEQPSRESIDDPSCAATSCVVIAVSSHIGVQAFARRAPL